MRLHCNKLFTGCAGQLLLLTQLLFILGCNHFGDPEEHPSPGTTINLVQAFGSEALPVNDIARLRTGYLLADSEGDQLLELDAEGNVKARWSHFSTPFSKIQNPLYLGHSDEGATVAYLGATRTVVRFDEGGRVLQTFPIEDFFGFGLVSSDRLWIGRPWDGTLITTYDAAGKEQKTFGALKMFREAYPEMEDATSIEPSLRDPFSLLNLVHVEADHRGGAFLTFRFAPIVQRYDHRGQLLWETRLQGEDIEDLVDLYLQNEKREGKHAVRMEVYGTPANLVTLGSAFDPRTGHLYVLLPNQRILRLNEDGYQEQTVLPRFSEQSHEPYPFLLAIHSLGPGELLFTNPIMARSWRASIGADLIGLPSGE